MLEDKYKELISKLLLRTERNELSWQNTADEKQYIIYQKDYSVTIYKSSSFDGVQVVITLRDDEGRTIDSFQVDERESGSSEIFRLYESARRKANNVEAVLDKLLHEF